MVAGEEDKRRIRSQAQVRGYRVGGLSCGLNGIRQLRGCC